MDCIDAGQMSQGRKCFPFDAELSSVLQQFAFLQSAAACRAAFSRAGQDFQHNTGTRRNLEDVHVAH